MSQESGIFDMSSEQYHADPCEKASLSAGVAQVLLERSPRHAWWAHPRLNPEYVAEENRKFDIGTCAHALLLEGLDHALVIEADDWRTKNARAQADEARMAGKIPLLTKDYAAVKAMVLCAERAYKDCSDLKGYALADCVREQSMIWQDGETWCRARPDAMAQDRRLIVDAKFTKTNANPDAFVAQISRMAYDLRGGFYLRGNTALEGAEDAKYVFLVQETYPPYCSVFIGLDPAYIELGASKAAQAISLWNECMQSNSWPGYLPRIHWASPPAWTVAQFQQREIEEWESQQ